MLKKIPADQIARQGGIRDSVAKPLEHSTRLYRPLEWGEQIVIFGDPSEGSRSYCAAVATSKKHADQPLVFNAKIESSQFGYELHKMAKFVHNHTNIWPEIAVERNTGQATIHVLDTLNYPQLFRMKIFDSAGRFQESSKIGWTTTSATRTKILDDFSLAVKQRSVTIFDREQISQMMTFVQKQLRSGVWKAVAESGKNDDLVIAGAGSWQLYLIVPSAEIDDWDEEGWEQEQEKWRFR